MGKVNRRTVKSNPPFRRFLLRLTGVIPAVCLGLLLALASVLTGLAASSPSASPTPSSMQVLPRARDAKPAAAKPGFRLGSGPATPAPGGDASDDADADAAVPAKTAPPAAGMLARRRPTPSKPSKGADSPSAASPSPAASPATADSGSPEPSPTASPSPAATAPTPSPDPASPAFLQKYEAAYVKFLEKDFAGAKALLDEADAIQASQPSSLDLRSKIFSHFYQAAYVKYLEKDYGESINLLGEADNAQRDQPDSLNLRGLISSRQHGFEQAETMFKKAVEADPSFWAAKFNLAELPFTYKNYTEARNRYEKLLTETDVAKQPREAELTQFKIFLTLLLEGKKEGARAFMDHFRFTGTTPARYYCQAALEFYSGNTDSAQQWIASARREYPAQIEAIFADSFYRVGWLYESNAKPGAGSSPAVASGSTPAASPAIVMATPSPAAPSPTAGLTVAMASPTRTPLPSPSPSPAVAQVSPSLTAAVRASPSPAVALASPSPSVTARPSPSPALVQASPSPSPTVQPLSSPAIARASPAATARPTASPSPSPAMAQNSPAASPTVSPRPTATPAAAPVSPKPQVSPAKASPSAAATATPRAVTPTPTPTASPASEAGAKGGGDDVVLWLLGAFVLLQIVASWIYVVRRAAAIKARKRRPGLRYAGGKKPVSGTGTES